ncbi:MAG: hypothetical protein D6702_02495 [Planctomycetota bacterium]|nr:MAG: hypothetical protein D6702_02495 [Planctomycetota bacterium]
MSRRPAVAAAFLALAAGGLAAQEGGTRTRSAFENEIVWTVRPLTSAWSWLFEGRFEDLAGVAYDRVAHEVVALDQRQGRAGMFTPDLFPKFAFGGPQAMRNPGNLVVDLEGRIWVTFARVGALRRFNYRGDWLDDIEVPGATGRANLSFLDLAPDGSILVGDAEAGQVLCLEADSGALRWRLGRKGYGRGRFSSPSGAAWSPDGSLLYVLERGTPPPGSRDAFVVQAFRASDREYQFGWGRHADGKMNFSAPAAIAVTPAGLVVVCDAIQHAVKVFDSMGKFLFQFGGLGTRPGDTYRPVDLAAGDGQILYVAEKGTGRIQAFEFFREVRKNLPPGAPSGKEDSLLGEVPKSLGFSADPFGLD